VTIYAGAHLTVAVIFDESPCNRGWIEPIAGQVEIFILCARQYLLEIAIGYINAIGRDLQQFVCGAKTLHPTLMMAWCFWRIQCCKRVCASLQARGRGKRIDIHLPYLVLHMNDDKPAVRGAPSRSKRVSFTVLTHSLSAPSKRFFTA
jgi:hypothetical protein